MKQQNNPPLCNVKDTKEFFSSAMKIMFSPVVKRRSISMGAFSTPVNVTVLEKPGKSEVKVIIFAPGNSHS